LNLFRCREKALAFISSLRKELVPLHQVPEQLIHDMQLHAKKTKPQQPPNSFACSPLLPKSVAIVAYYIAQERRKTDFLETDLNDTV